MPPVAIRATQPTRVPRASARLSRAAVCPGPWAGVKLGSTAAPVSPRCSCHRAAMARASSGRAGEIAGTVAGISAAPDRERHHPPGRSASGEAGAGLDRAAHVFLGNVAHAILQGHPHPALGDLRVLVGQFPVLDADDVMGQRAHDGRQRRGPVEHRGIGHHHRAEQERVDGGGPAHGHVG
ncbi:MAG: hypothetical protein ACK559_02975, partial [bacterium]